MKRCWFGGGLLLLLLLAGLWTGGEMARFCEGLSGDMTQAARCTGPSREAAQQRVEEVREAWERRRILTSVLSDHGPMEEIEENFALLTRSAETEDFRETCLRIAAQLKALAEAQLLSWENLL